MLDNDIKTAQKIVTNPFSNCKDDVFHRTSFIYRGSNERTEKFVDLFENKKDILTVISSSDQLLNAILMGAINIDAFDISNFPKYYMWLKIAAIKSLDRDDYINFFYDAVSSKQEVYDDMYFDAIRKNLDNNAEKFWTSLINYYDWNIITYSSLFSGEVVSSSNAINKNRYLKLDNYKKMKSILNSVNIKTYEGNILNLAGKLDKMYDLIYLSNIIGYVDKTEYKNMLSRFNLKEDGAILTYIYDYNKRIENFFSDTNSTFNRFDDKAASGILIYKK